ncbi:MAG: hypothetical protein AB1791_16705 [Chloroflexota bacterium]
MRRHIATLMVLLGWVLLAVARPAAAHGGGALLLSSAAAGPYKVTVWVAPPEARVGPVHVSAAVSDADGLNILTDVQVMVEAVHLEGAAAAQTAAASTENSANKFTYEADMALTEAGRYQMTVMVNGAAGGGEASFELDVKPASQAQWFVAGGIGLIIVAVVVVYRRRQAYNSSA